MLQAAGESFTFCLPLEASDFPNIVQKCNDSFELVEGAQVTCMTAGSIDGCVSAINNGQADFTKMGPSDAFIANREYGLEPLITEYYGGDAGNSYYGVAVVRKEFCEGNQVTLADLKGTRSCHTGYRKTSGWTIPVGFMTDNGIMEVVNNDDNVPNDVETVASFFSQTCAPGSDYSQLCTACGGDCSESDPYADYEGSVRGLMEDACDVAFTKQSIVPTVASDGSAPEAWATLKMDDLRLVCPLGGCRPVSDWKTCNLAAIPSQAFMGPVSLQRSAKGKVLISSLDAAGQDPAFINAARNIDGSEEILTDKTQRLDPVGENSSFIDYLGRGTSQAYLGIEQLQASASSSGSDDGLSGGAIAGIVIGCLTGVALIAGAGFFIWKKKKGTGSSSYGEFKGSSGVHPLTI